MSRRPALLPNRATALVAALCVFALTVLAASPGLHAGLHGHADSATGQSPGHPHDQHHGHEHGHDHGGPVDQAGHACAVTLFASGVTTLLVFCLLTLMRPPAAGILRRADHKTIASLPRYRLVPSHAPPAA